MIAKFERPLLAPVVPNVIMLAADLVRDLIRSIAVQDPAIPRGRAIEDAYLLIQLIERCKAEVTIDALITGVVKELTDIPEPEGDLHEDALQRVARAGLTYLADLSACDDGAPGRAARRRQELEAALSSFVEADRERLKRVRANQRKWAGTNGPKKSKDKARKRTKPGGPYDENPL